MIRIGMIRQNTRYSDERRCHPGRAWCEVAGRRFEATGPRAIYNLATLLWLHGHGGADFEVHDDRSPSGKPRRPGHAWASAELGQPRYAEGRAAVQVAVEARS